LQSFKFTLLIDLASKVHIFFAIISVAGNDVNCSFFMVLASSVAIVFKTTSDIVALILADVKLVWFSSSTGQLGEKEVVAKCLILNRRFAEN